MKKVSSCYRVDRRHIHHDGPDSGQSGKGRGGRDRQDTPLIITLTVVGKSFVNDRAVTDE
ncbi:MAG: hypothetical protein NTZ28_01835 [Nitrospirae bacterium]|nr:hypothetical protein [Nitrospirota bacterium]